MALNIMIKEPQKDFLDDIVEKYAFSDCSEVIQALVKFASIDNPETNNDLFEMRCVGKCNNPGITVSIDISNEEAAYLKRMSNQYDIEDYDTEEEKQGKAIRCLINYADQDGDPKAIFAK